MCVSLVCNTANNPRRQLNCSLLYNIILIRLNTSCVVWYSFGQHTDNKMKMVKVLLLLKYYSEEKHITPCQRALSQPQDNKTCDFITQSPDDKKGLTPLLQPPKSPDSNYPVQTCKEEERKPVAAVTVYRPLAAVHPANTPSNSSETPATV